MNRRLFAAMVVAAIPSAARADEVATVVNDSQLNVTFRLRWSFLPNWSAPITLAPGEVWRTVGPNGQQVFMDYNCTPVTQPPTIVPPFRLITATLPPGVGGAGYRSRFVQVDPNRVELVRE